MKYSEIRTLGSKELDEKLVGVKDTLHKLRFAHSISPIKNPMLIGENRKLIARIKTAQNEQKLKNS